MATVEEQLQETGTSAEGQGNAASSRRELKDWQAQLIALVVTLGLLTLFVLLFSWVTGSL